MTYYRTPDDYLTTMIESVRSAGAPITDFNVGSVARTLFEAFATALSQQSATLDALALDSYLATATGDALDAKAGDYLVARKAAVPAAGVIRITRQTTGTTLFIPAGWAQLTTKPVPGQDGVAVATTEDATMGTSDTYIDIPAQAVLGGVAGNIAAPTALVPQTALTGVPDGGIVVHTSFTGGVDTEADDAFRRAIRTTVQGRVNGTAQALEAAALAVPGVESANVLKAGDMRADTSTVPAGECEVYYEGEGSLLASVLNACEARSVVNQGLSVFTATAERMYVACTVNALTGTDSAFLAALVIDAIRGVVNAVGVGEKLYYSDTIQAIHDVAGVLSVNVPLADHRKYSASSGTAGNVAMAADRYASLDAVDVSVAVVLI